MNPEDGAKSNRKLFTGLMPNHIFNICPDKYQNCYGPVCSFCLLFLPVLNRFIYSCYLMPVSQLYVKCVGGEGDK